MQTYTANQLLNNLIAEKQAEIDARRSPSEISPSYRQLKAMATTDKSLVMENLVIGLAQQEVDASAHAAARRRACFDAVILGKRVEVRMATQGIKSETFQFNGTLFGRDYDYFMFVGLCRNGEIRFQCYSAKSVQNGDVGSFCSMDKHGGNFGSQKLTRTPTQLLPISQFRDRVISVLVPRSKLATNMVVDLTPTPVAAPQPVTV